MRWLIAAALLIAGCAGSTFVEPATGPPAVTIPIPTSDNIVIEGNTATDNSEVVGTCLRAFLWAESSDGPEWVLVKVNERELNTGRPNEVGCEASAGPGPLVADVLAGLPDGWYTVCSTATICTEPFEKT